MLAEPTDCGLSTAPSSTSRMPTAIAPAPGARPRWAWRGKWAIHPNQIALANEIFSPSPDQVAWAERLLEAMKEATAAGRGAVSLDGKMIDMAHLKVAEIIQRKRDAIAANQ